VQKTGIPPDPPMPYRQLDFGLPQKPSPPSMSLYRIAVASSPAPLTLTALLRRVMAAAVVAGLSGCGSKPTSASAPAPAAAPAAPAWLSCPGPSDGASIVSDDINEAHRAFASNPSTQLPPACVFSALAGVATGVTDSTVARALVLAAEVRRRGPATRELAAAEVVLLARAHRYAEVTRAYDRLVALDSQPAFQVVRLALGAARQRGDTVSLLRILARTVPRHDATAAMRTEYNVVRQASQLWAAINEARGLIRQNPRYLAAYPSLVGNFGTLGLADSVVATSRRAFAAGATRSAILPSVELLVSAMLRHAALYGSAYAWDSAIASASRVDSVLSTPSTKFLTATLIVYAAETRSSEIGALVGTPAMSRTVDAAMREQRATGCRRIPAVSASLDLAERRMREVGDGYQGGGQVRSGITAAREKLSSLQDICMRSGE